MSKQKEVKSKNKEANKTVSQELLDSVRESLFKLKDYLNNIDFTKDDGEDDSKKALSIITIIEKMGKGIETLAILEKKVALDEQDKSKIRGNVKLSLLEGGEL
jgi:hypothetical protein